MPASYEPADDAKPIPPWSIATLSERDLSLRVPINFVTIPGVSLRQACFGHDTFVHDAAVTCFSNLLAAGFRRFEWDLFWDPTRRVWSFCPVQIPQSESSGVTSTTQILFNSSTITVSDAVISARALASSSPGDQLYANTTLLDLLQRQVADARAISDESDGGSRTSLDPTLSGSATATAPSTTTSTSATTSGGLVTIGQYTCSPSIDIPVLEAVLAGYFGSTSNTLDAFLTYLTLNLHVAARTSQSVSQVLNASALPNPSETVSLLLGVNLTSYLYTPALLARERADVNSSWYSAASDTQPLLGYFNLTHNTGSASTENGWPNGHYLEFNRQRRLLAQFGRIDPELGLYNLSADDDVIFPAGYLQDDLSDVRLSADGNIETGCLYNQNDLTIGGNNNSWATFTMAQFPAERAQDFGQRAITEVANLTNCGISTFLNTTLFNSTADENISHYNDLLRSTTWAWNYGEPRIVSNDEENASKIRCAAMDRNSNGRWRVVDCTDKHYAACRVGGDQFSWRISSTRATYTSSNDICDDGQAFSAPLTVLENRHLFRQMQQEMRDDTLVWVNFNSLDLGNCWVVGVNNTCPYRGREQDDSGRKIIVPTVAAIIVFIVTALTLFVKCAANRQTNKRRRRRRDGQEWLYEGIPQ
jgi:hypothetical protein